MVIGAPSNGWMNSLYTVYGCGDVCIDLVGCSGCKQSIKGDLVDVLKTKNTNSYVIFESCVLESVDPQKKKTALKEMGRVGGENCFEVRISPTIYVHLLADSNQTNIFSQLNQYGYQGRRQGGL